MPTFDNDPGIGLDWFLEKLCVIAEGWRILAVVTGAATLVAVATALLLPVKFRSEAILPITAKALAAYDSDVFLNAVLSNSFLVDDSGGDTEAARRKLRRILEKPVDLRSSGLFKIGLTESSRERANDLLSRTVSRILEYSRPVGSERLAIIQQIEALERSIPELEKLSSQIAQNVRHIEDGLESEQFARAIANLYSDISQRRLKIIELKRLLEGAGLGDVVQPPTQGERVGAGRAYLAIAIVLAAFCGVAGYLLARDLYRRMVGDKVRGPMLKRLMNAFSLTPVPASVEPHQGQQQKQHQPVQRRASL